MRFRRMLPEQVFQFGHTGAAAGSGLEGGSQFFDRLDIPGANGVDQCIDTDAKTETDRTTGIVTARRRLAVQQ